MFTCMYMRIQSVITTSKDLLQTLPLKGVGYPQMDQKVCLNMVKKDQLCAIALKKRN